MDEFEDIVNIQKKFFLSGQTRGLEFRKKQLKLLLKTIKNFEHETIDACFEDLGKPVNESYSTEIGSVCAEIKNAIKNLDNWAKPTRVGGMLALFPSSSYICWEPLGRILIFGPWNYPHQLCLMPLIGSIAAGNCSIIKPSELTPKCSAVLSKMINSIFEPEYIKVIEGDIEVGKSLLQYQFDHIFFTGSYSVARQVMMAAAKNITPVTLELGGKSPCIVDKDVDLHITAKRIIWGKLLNAGQSCIAPDYLFVHESIHENLISLLIKYIEEFYPNLRYDCKNYTKIVNRNHFNRLKNILANQKIIYGGILDEDSKFISPTLVDSPNLESPIMQEEIFGPILPIFSYDNLNYVINIVQNKPKPLSLYLFSNNISIQNKVIDNISFGGGCINDTFVHATNNNLPFGGIGDSGMGAYHGKYTFELLSHRKSILKKPFLFDSKLRYPPYTWIKSYIIRNLF